MHLAEGAAYHREVLGEDEDLAPVDRAVADDHALAGGLDLSHTELVAAMLDEGVELDEAARIEKGGYPLSGRHLALLVLGGRPLGPSALENLVPTLLELSDFIFHTPILPFTKVRFLSTLCLTLAKLDKDPAR